MMSKPMVWFLYIAIPQQGDHRLSGPPPGQGADEGVRTRDRRVPAYLCVIDPLQSNFDSGSQALVLLISGYSLGHNFKFPEEAICSFGFVRIAFSPHEDLRLLGPYQGQGVGDGLGLAK
ncbi:hypothetical protein PoB_004283500 [Plakobranchus ocellatus]|uniref:Uncharacterized protein n=1 Tax=Plakobranchus ocellatus TaxID=259542 RepID=A0AAV4B6V3_9GAST|nr:hypothetical protein PoB_004283500 [Plakobranchus ocellatus]